MLHLYFNREHLFWNLKLRSIVLLDQFECCILFLLNGPAEALNSKGSTWAIGLTWSDTTAWLTRSKCVTEPPLQYSVRPLLLVLDKATEYWNPLGHGCDVSTSPSPMISRRTAVFSGAITSQVKVRLNSVRMEGWVSTVAGLHAVLVHSGKQ